jgi:hypothetical protein
MIRQFVLIVLWLKKLTRRMRAACAVWGTRKLYPHTWVGICRGGDVASSRGAANVVFFEVQVRKAFLADAKGRSQLMVPLCKRLVLSVSV